MNHQILFHDNKSGYVIRCESCENLQVTFGNFIVTFGKASFNQFISLIKRIKAQQETFADISVKSIIIPTPCNEVKLLISFHELPQLESMLDAADSERQSLKLLNYLEKIKFHNYLRPPPPPAAR